MKKLHEQLVRAYRSRNGFLTPEEIKGVRKSCGVTQSEFERMLGVKPPTCSRWESGAVLQSPTANQLMWLMKSAPCVIDALKRKAAEKAGNAEFASGRRQHRGV